MHSCPKDDCDFKDKVLYNIYYHLVSHHKWTKGQVGKMKEERAEAAKQKAEAAKKARQAELPERCQYCEERFSTRKSCQQHVRRLHKVEKPDYKTVTCPMAGCVDRFASREQLAGHCADAHATEEAPFRVEERTFKEEEEFLEWKRHLENSTKSSFSVESSRGVVSYYWCSRGNRDRRREDSNKPKRSKRVQAYCSAFLNVRRNVNGPIRVRFCRDHIGHDTSLAKLPLNQAEKEQLFSLIDQGFGLSRLKEELRNEGSSNRLYWLSERQLRSYVNHHRKNAAFQQFHPLSNDHQSIVDRFEADVDDLPVVPPTTLQRVRAHDIDLVHDYCINEMVEMDDGQFEAEVKDDDRAERSRERIEQRTAQAYMMADRLLNEAVRRVEQAMRRGDYEQLEAIVSGIQEALNELEGVDGEADVPQPRPYRARGHAAFVPSNIKTVREHRASPKRGRKIK